MHRGNTFLCLVFMAVVIESLTDNAGYSGPILLITGICLLAHYRFIGGSHLTFKRKRHAPAAKAIAKRLVETRIRHVNDDREDKYKLYRAIMVDGFNSRMIERRLIHSFRLSLMKEIKNEEALIGSRSLLTADIDPVIDNIVLCFDKDTTWR